VRAFRAKVSEAVLAPFAARVKQRYADFSWPGENSAEAAVWTLIHARPPQLLDPRYPDWHALLVDAAKQVTTELAAQPGGLAARSWGERNRAGIRHPLSAALPRWLGRHIDMPDQPIPGDNNMPHVAAPGFGASEHLDVSPGHEADAILNMPGGQSDHPLSPYFGAGHEDWVKGRPTSLLPGSTLHTLTLQPGTR
jgi:penicillin amidase